jgi:excisionase family DNA binding protein
VSFVETTTPLAERLAVSIEDACALSGIGRTTLYKLIADGLLPARKCGRRTLILVTDLKALVLGLPTVVGSH